VSTIRERLVYAIDIVGDGARKGLAGIKQSVAEADGAIGKFKAGATSAMASIGVSAGTLGIAAGGALVAFGAKAVAASQQTALAAGKLAEATGLTVEQASRLNEVASDLNISGETLTSVVKKMAVEIGKGNPLLEQYGIALQHTADGSADVNATLLDTITRIGQIEDPTKRAAAAQAAFGRGYAQAAELIFSNADQLKQKLDEVSDAKIVTPEELARAREFRDNLKNLQDVAEDLTIVAGEFLVPALTEVSGQLADLAAGAKHAADEINKIPGVPDFIKFAIRNLNPLGQQVLLYRKLGDGVEFLQNKFSSATPAGDRFNDSVLRGGTTAKTADGEVTGLGGALTETGEAAADTADEVADLGDKAANSGPKIGDMAAALDDARDHLADLNEEARDNALGILADAAAAVGDALDESFGSLEDDLGALDLLDDITDQFDKIAEAQKAATDPQGVRDLNREVRRLQGLLLDYLRTVDDIPPDKVTEIIAQIRTGDIETLRATLDEITKDRFINIGIATKGIPLFNGANVNFNPAAGTIAPVINQTPTQAAIPSSPINNNNVTIIYPVGSTPTTQYIDGQIDLRRNGTRS
jgi:uncharacterized phage infection (PIP) family protein YhgE